MEALYNETKQDEQLTSNIGEQNVPSNQNIVPTQQKIISGSIAIGEGNSVFKADNDGIYLGNIEFSNAPFRVSPSGDLVASSVNITGGEISTSGTGFQRIRIVTNAGTSPTQSANSLALINSSNNIIAFLGTSSNGILEIKPINTSQTALYIANDTNLQLTDALAQLSVAKTDSSGKTLILTNVGTNDTLSVSNSGSGKGIDVNVNGSTGIGGYFTSTNGSNGNNTIESYKAGGGSGSAIYCDITGNNAVASGSFKQATSQSTNFYRVLKLSGGSNDMYIWVSNGTDPNGSLSGTQGSICLNCSGAGVIKYCSGGTTWV